MLQSLALNRILRWNRRCRAIPESGEYAEAEDVLEGIPAFGDTARHATAVNLRASGRETRSLGARCSDGDPRRLGLNE
jgi:hypothetical protein